MAAQVILNQTRRWNWGLVGGQVPYVTGFIDQTIDNAEVALVQTTTLFRQSERSVSGLLAYPFNRAHRIEFQAGFTQIAFDQIVRTQKVSRSQTSCISTRRRNSRSIRTCRS